MSPTLPVPMRASASTCLGRTARITPTRQHTHTCTKSSMSHKKKPPPYTPQPQHHHTVDILTRGVHDHFDKGGTRNNRTMQGGMVPVEKREDKRSGDLDPVPVVPPALKIPRNELTRRLKKYQPCAHPCASHVIMDWRHSLTPAADCY